jgi:hypothetical protein
MFYPKGESFAMHTSSRRNSDPASGAARFQRSRSSIPAVSGGAWANRSVALDHLGLERQGAFLRHRQIPRNVVAWVEREVSEWMRSKVDAGGA